MAWQMAALLLLSAHLFSTVVSGLSVSKREASLFDSDLFVFSSGPFSDKSKSFQGFLPIYPSYGHASERTGRQQSHRSASSPFSLEEGPLPTVNHPTRGAQLTTSGLPLEFSLESARAAKQPSSALSSKPFTVFDQQPRRGKALNQFSSATSGTRFASGQVGQQPQQQRQVFGFSGSQRVQQPAAQFGNIQGFDGFDQFEPFDQIQASQPQQSLQQEFQSQPQPQQFQPQQFQSQTVFPPQQPQFPAQPQHQQQFPAQPQQQFPPQRQQQFRSQPQKPQFQPEQLTGFAARQRANDRQGSRLHLPSQPVNQPSQPVRQFQPQPATQLEPQANLDPRQKETLFSSINKPATDREPRRQLADPSKMNHMSRNDALARLMDIAGSDWDLSVSIEQNLVGGSDGGSDFDCPTPEGHFPDQERCHIYYQCSNGIANKQKCPSGLKYNVLTNQCDWEASVDCSLNKDPRMLRQHAGPSPRPQQAPQSFNSQPFSLEQQQQQQQQILQQLPFSNFFRF